MPLVKPDCFFIHIPKTGEVEFVSLDFSKCIKDAPRLFLRGLAKSKNSFFIGITGYCEKTEMRGDVDNWIVELDNDLNIVDCVEAPKEAKTIREIRLINEFDYAHGQPTLKY